MKSGSKPFVRWIWWTLGVLVLLLAASVLYASKTHWFPRLEDRPAFDSRKAAALTPERRAAFELELFSELPFWNMGGTSRYRGVEGILAREARWREMAADGFELAAIVLRVLDPSGGIIYSPRGPMHRLEELAEGGDAGAMCLMVGLINVAALRVDWRPYQPTYTRWLVEGARRGHPECLEQLGGRLIRGSDGFERDIDRGIDLMFEAARSGYVHGAGTLYEYFRAKRTDDPASVRRLYCWATVADSAWTSTREWDRRAALLAKLQQRQLLPTVPDLARLTSELRSSNYTASDCIQLGRGD